MAWALINDDSVINKYKWRRQILVKLFFHWAVSIVLILSWKAEHCTSFQSRFQSGHESRCVYNTASILHSVFIICIIQISTSTSTISRRVPVSQIPECHKVFGLTRLHGRVLILFSLSRPSQTDYGFIRFGHLYSDWGDFMDHFHSDWTFKPIEVLHVNAPSEYPEV